MAFGYNPKDASGCLEKGEYDAELAGVEEKQSKKGSAMLEVAWSVVDPDGERRRIKDYIVNPSTLFKLKNIARAWSMERDFDEQSFDLAEHIGKQIVLKLDVESSVGFGDRNTIAGYLSAVGRAPLSPSNSQSQQPSSPPAESGEFIPF